MVKVPLNHTEDQQMKDMPFNEYFKSEIGITPIVLTIKFEYTGLMMSMLLLRYRYPTCMLVNFDLAGQFSSCSII